MQAKRRRARLDRLRGWIRGQGYSSRAIGAVLAVAQSADSMGKNRPNGKTVSAD